MDCVLKVTSEHIRILQMALCSSQVDFWELSDLDTVDELIERFGEILRSAGYMDEVEERNDMAAH